MGRICFLLYFDRNWSLEGKEGNAKSLKQLWQERRFKIFLHLPFLFAFSFFGFLGDGSNIPRAAESTPLAALLSILAYICSCGISKGYRAVLLPVLAATALLGFLLGKMLLIFYGTFTEFWILLIISSFVRIIISGEALKGRKTR